MTSQQPTPTTPTTSYLDLGITLAIHAWPALSLAVKSLWGGPTSSDKRDWLCGAISDMLNDRPETDAEDLEDVLIQVMNDEFDVVVDDESAAPIAAKIMEVKMQVARGDVAGIWEMWEQWEKKKEQKGGDVEGFKRGEDEDQDTDADEDEEGESGDVDMGEAPALVRAPKEKPQPEVDDDGFTKVVGKKR